MSHKHLNNQENIFVPHSKRIKISDEENAVPIFGGRTVLGNLNTSSNLRIQPRRAAKQGVQYEKGFAKFAQKKSFASNASGHTKVQTSTFPSIAGLTNLIPTSNVICPPAYLELKKLPISSTVGSSGVLLQKPPVSTATSFSGFALPQTNLSKSNAASTSAYALPQNSSISSVANASGLVLSQNQSLSGTVSSGFTIYSDASANTSGTSFTTHRSGLLPPSSFTSCRASISSENSNESSYLSDIATSAALPVPAVSNSTTLSDCIKQSLKVTDESNKKVIPICDKENDYFKPKLEFPINFGKKVPAQGLAERKPLASVADVVTILSSRKLTKSNDFSLREEIILKRRAESIWTNSIYSKEIYAHLRLQEMSHKPKPHYIQKQAEITSNMRYILIDWLVEVAAEYDLYPQTLYLAVSYVDRFLSFMSVKRDKLQLVGTTAMLIASKYEEIYPPEAKQFAYITDSTYRIEQIIKMEQLILRVLSFQISNPTIFQFTNNFAMMCNSDEKTTHLCQFIAELSMLECEPFLAYLPSVIAATALAIAHHTLGLPVWPEVLRIQSGYELDQLRNCYVHLHKSYTITAGNSPNSIREKYKADHYHCVGDIPPRHDIPFM